MTRIVYVSGTYHPYERAGVHVEDRGFQFSDGVYEVCEVRAGQLIDERRHIDRLHRSMNELRMQPPVSRRALGVIMRETVRRNRVHNGLVYLQITRGAAKRDFAFPPADIAATIVCYARSKSPAAAERRAARGIRVVTMPDIRWRRPDIKTVSLLPNALARQAAQDAGAEEAWLVDDDGFVTEGASSNAWILTENDELVTRPATARILRGITRTVLIELIAEQGLNLVERPFTVNEAQSAKQAFNTSATGVVMPVIAIDGVPIGDGRPGALTLTLRRLFGDYAERSPAEALLQ
jgi:D-alanine transaminase